ncbi:30S ribosomal protein S12 methylthiotransferase RimO [Myxococcota bacterium]|nr:30S ribosomal protein S12 methylthiotransferase RimO [Myxococcota bacterium]
MTERPERTVHFVSLGCPKNRVDSEVMLGHLQEGGYGFTDVPEEADLIVVNTCTFIGAATEESVDAVLDAVRMKEAGRAKRVVVAGCMAQRHHGELQKEIPEVDAFVGTGEYQNILKVLDGGERGRALVGLPVYVQQEDDPRINTLSSSSAYVKILEGCPQQCSFCIIPTLRGGLRSRPPAQVVREVRLLAASGVKEIILVGQDNTSYGYDLGPDVRLAGLLRQLGDVPGVEWIRVMYVYPARFPDDLLDAMVEVPQVVPYVDMPLQHIHDDVLRRMRRGMGSDKTRRLVDRIRGRIPEVALRTGFIVGFPGETDEAFRELHDFVAEARFDRMGVFTYSPEEGTPAASMDGAVPEKVKKQRRDALMRLQRRIHREKNRALVGSLRDVLVEGYAEGTDLVVQGRMTTQAPEIDGQVYVTAGRVDIGRIQPVRISGVAGDYDLVAESLVG